MARASLRICTLNHVRLVNDVEAAAYGIGVLEPSELETIHAGVPSPRSTQIVIAAGTGLGEGILFWDGHRHVPMATEAGHADFAPNTQQQAELWKFLNKRAGICERGNNFVRGRISARA